MKTAMELLGICGRWEGERFSAADLELVAKRAREEMREMAYETVCNICDPCKNCGSEGDCDRCQGLARAETAIRALPVRT